MFLTPVNERFKERNFIQLCSMVVIALEHFLETLSTEINN